jgi:hypothetical protein
MTKRHPYEALRQVAVIAGGIWLESAGKKTKWSSRRYVRYADLERLRVALEAAGYDMEAALKRFKQQGAVPDEKENVA